MPGSPSPTPTCRPRARERVEALVASRQRLVEAGETQRRRFGQELHDAVETRLARIAGIVFELQACGELPAELLDELLAGLEATRGELRDVAAGLLPRELTDAGLASALHNLAARTASSVDVAVGCGRLPQPVEATVYYVCAEALSNVAKHASASHVRVDVRVHDGAVLTVIQDDGVGGADEALGSGLRGLCDRVEATGGRLTVTSRPGRGTRLVATVPQIAGTPDAHGPDTCRPKATPTINVSSVDTSVVARHSQAPNCGSGALPRPSQPVPHPPRTLNTTVMAPGPVTNRCRGPRPTMSRVAPRSPPRRAQNALPGCPISASGNCGPPRALPPGPSDERLVASCVR